MTDDLKQRADADWNWLAERTALAKWIRAAVEASIAAALAPLVERVARLEGRITDSGVVIPKPPPAEAKCAECQGALFTHELLGKNRRGPCFDQPACQANRRPCPKCSKPEPRRAMCTQHDAPYPCVQCGDLAAPAPSAQKAPERIVRYWEDHGFLWETEQHIGTVRVEYVRADVHTRECSTQRLIAANARVEELERLQLRMEDVASSAYDAARAEGRADGIREAAGIYERWALAGVVSMSPRGVMNDILAMLDKTREK